jgi:flagellin-like hook-associated protein FlgL
MINLTDQMIYRLGNLNTEQTRISYQMSTGKLLDKGSDDSSVFSRQLYVDNKIRIYEGLQTQIEKIDGQNNVADSSMNEIKDLLDQIKLEIKKVSSAGNDAQTRASTATIVGGMKENLLTLVNEKVNGEYLFSGTDSTVRPFIQDANGVVTYQGNASVKKIAVEQNTYRDKGITGFDAMFYDKDEGSVSDPLKFSLDERIIDQNNVEWHLSDAAEGYQLTFGIDETINRKTLAGAVGNEWALSEATVGHQLTFDAHDSGNILDNNGVSWVLNGLQLEKTGGTGTGDDVIAVTLIGPPDIYKTDAITESKGITKLSVGTTLSLREIDSGNMTGTPTIEVENVLGDQYRTTEVLSTTVNNAGAPVESFTTADSGISFSGTGISLRHFDSFGALVTADTKAGLTVDIAAVDVNTKLVIREYTLSNAQISSEEFFKAKHNIFDDINLAMTALETNTETTNGTNVGFNEMHDIMNIAFDSTNVAHSMLGSRNKIFELSLTTIGSKLTHFNILSQEVGGVDLGKVAMEAKALEMTYTALYSTISKMNSLSLVNFIR